MGSIEGQNKNGTDKGIEGLKQSEFKDASEFFGEAGFNIGELPDGIRLYLKDKVFDLKTGKLIVNIYRLVDDGGLKQRKSWVGKVENRRPEESEIAERFGPGRYVWMGKWLDGIGTERGIISDVIEIASDVRVNAMRGGDTGVTAPPALAGPAPTPPAAFGIMEMLQLMDAAEEKTLARMERITAMLQAGKSADAGEVLNKAYQGASEMMQRAVQTNLDMVRSVGKQNQAALEAAALPPPDDDEGEDEDEVTGPKLPDWLAPFMPHLKTGMEKLLGGGPVGAAYKTLILTSGEWKEIFSDPAKWGQAVSAMETEFGAERTTKALNILLNKRDAKPVKPEVKPKKNGRK